MYERFTDRARMVMQLAHREAKRANRKHIDAADVLLGLLASPGPTPPSLIERLATILKRLLGRQSP